ncbi:Cyclin-A2 [Chamberlinius hualienensis]
MSVEIIKFFGVMSQTDQTLLNDPRVLRNMLKLEYEAVLEDDYFKTFQIGFGEDARLKLTSWMHTICDGWNSDNAVFPSAVAILDQFLNIKRIPKEKLQLIGCTCLLLTSKLRTSFTFVFQNLLDSTDNMYENLELLDCEAEMLEELGWDISIVTAMDFLEYFLAWLKHKSTIEITDEFESTSIIVLSSCLEEFYFALKKPSITAIACLCVTATMHNLSAKEIQHIKTTLITKSNKSQEAISECIIKVESLNGARYSSIVPIASASVE